MGMEQPAVEMTCDGISRVRLPCSETKVSWAMDSVIDDNKEDCTASVALGSLVLPALGAKLFAVSAQCSFTTTSSGYAGLRKRKKRKRQCFL